MKTPMLAESRYRHRPSSDSGALICAVTSLTAAPMVRYTPQGTPVSDSMLSGAAAPSGATLTVAGFRLPGAAKPTAPGPGAAQVIDPVTGRVTGTLVMRADGTFTFAPAAGFTGTVPTVYVTVSSSDGQSKEVPLTIIVETTAGEHACRGGQA